MTTSTTNRNTCSNLFGLLIGEWNFEWTDKLFPERNRHLKGEWSFKRLPQYHGICDTFICPSRSECAKSGLIPRPRITKRLYNLNTGEWNIYDGDDDNLNRYHTEFTANKIIIYDTSNNNSSKLRWIFSDILLNSFKWECQSLAKDGKTWITCEKINALRRSCCLEDNQSI